MNASPAFRSVMSGPRMSWLDTMRGIAALMVVWHHFYVVILHGFPEDGPLRATAAVVSFLAGGRWGVLGVPVFFVLSGYCVGQAWLRSMHWRLFAWRRIRRIFPAYYVSLALVVICAGAARLLTGVNDVASFPRPEAINILATLFLQTNPATHTPTVCWVYWSLTYEIAFYAVLTSVLVLPARWRVTGLIAIAAAAGMLAYLPESSLRPGPFFFCDLWPLFVTGLALALRSTQPRPALVLGGIAIIALPAIAFNPLYPGFVISAVIATMLVWLADAGVPLPRLRPLERLGDFSYSLYLVHVPILLLVGRWLILPAGTNAIMLFTGCAATIVLTLFIALWFYRWFERPFLSTTRATTLPQQP